MRVPPSVLSLTMYHMHAIRQHKVIQTAHNELTVHYAPKTGSSGIELRLKQALTDAPAQKWLENIVELKFKRVETIERDAHSGKYKPLVSMGPPGDQDGI